MQVLQKVNPFIQKPISNSKKQIINSVYDKLDNRVGDYLVSNTLKILLIGRNLTKVETQINLNCIDKSVAIIYNVSPPIRIGNLVNGRFIKQVYKFHEYNTPSPGLDAGTWKTYPVARTFWTTDQLAFRYITKSYEEFKGLHIRHPYSVKPNKRKLKAIAKEKAEREERLRIYKLENPEIIREYIPIDISLNPNRPHGILDIYPNKVRTDFNRYLVTTYGNGTSTVTDVSVDTSGNPVNINSIKLVRSNSMDEDLEYDSAEKQQITIKNKVFDDYPVTHYYVYKALEAEDGFPCIAKLRIPIEAEVAVTKFETKARCSEATVMDIYLISVNDGIVKYTEKISHAYNFVYKGKRNTYIVGETYKEILSKEDDPSIACGTGIHFCFSQEDVLKFHRIHTEEIANPGALI